MIPSEKFKMLIRGYKLIDKGTNETYLGETVRWAVEDFYGRVRNWEDGIIPAVGRILILDHDYTEAFGLFYKFKTRRIINIVDRTTEGVLFETEGNKIYYLEYL